ncbi:hypothetical protein HAX54_048788, partial [Datura stramonium]|nr:hypothetical protein [Datura stramonium]
NKSIKKPADIVEDVLAKVGKFTLLANFVVLDCAMDIEIPNRWAILERKLKCFILMDVNECK